MISEGQLDDCKLNWNRSNGSTGDQGTNVVTNDVTSVVTRCWTQEMGWTLFRKQLSFYSLMRLIWIIIALQSANPSNCLKCQSILCVKHHKKYVWCLIMYTLITGNILRPFLVTIISLVRLWNLFHNWLSSNSTRGCSLDDDWMFCVMLIRCWDTAILFCVSDASDNVSDRWNNNLTNC